MNSNRETGKSGVEQFLKDEVKKYGAVARKWVSPGYTGVPDQIVFWPTGLITFVETKAKKGKLDPRQVRVHAQLADFKHDVVVLHTKEAVRLWVELQASCLLINVVSIGYKTALARANMPNKFAIIDDIQTSVGYDRMGEY